MTTCGGEGTGWGWQEPKNNQVARVSPYRLAAHLTSAFVIYTGLLWTTLSVLHPLAAPAPAAAAAMRRARGLLLPVRCVKPLHRIHHPLARHATFLCVRSTGACTALIKHGAPVPSL